MISNNGDGLDIVSQAIEAVGIKHLEQRFFNELSGGERQKVILAMALAQQPELLLLDEPTAHLDISHQVEMLTISKQLNKEQGTTIIAAMHDLNFASLYFQRLILLKEGRIVADGSPQEVLTSPINRRGLLRSSAGRTHPLANVPYIIVLPERRLQSEDAFIK